VSLRSAGGSLRVDRLTGPDLGGFVPEKFGWPAEIGLIAVLDGAPLFDGDGRLRYVDVRDRIASRLSLCPRLRQVVHRPKRALGRPIWVDAPTFNIADHVRTRPLPAGAGQSELLQTCEELRQRPLDRSRPLWQLWLLPGLPDSAVGMFVRVHHAIADGLAGVELLSNLLDHTPDTTPPAASPWIPRPQPSPPDLLLDNIYGSAAAVSKASRRLLHPMALVDHLRQLWPPILEFLGERHASRTSLNAPLSAARRIAVITSSLSTVKEASHRLSVTVNDAVLAAVAGGLRELLQSRGERVDGLVLRAMVPVTLQNPTLGPLRGNLYGAMVVRLPIGEANPLRRLDRISAETASRKQRATRPWGIGVFGSPLMQRLTLPLAGRQHYINIHVANVRGPAEPLYLAGARLTTAFPLVPLNVNLTLGIGVLSYTDQLNITVVADRDQCPDLATFMSGMNHSMFGLIEAANPNPSEQRSEHPILDRKQD
jgi:diacylglycerol O-acyltransferase